MKYFLPAVAASILTIFAVAPPRLAAPAPGAPSSRALAKSDRPIVIAQVNPDVDAPQSETLQREESSDTASDADNSAESDDQNAAEAAQNGGPDSASDADQNAQADDNGENPDQDSGDAADTQADSGDAADQSADNAAGAP